jgi:hypothetical protein
VTVGKKIPGTVMSMAQLAPTVCEFEGWLLKANETVGRPFPASKNPFTLTSPPLRNHDDPIGCAGPGGFVGGIGTLKELTSRLR